MNTPLSTEPPTPDAVKAIELLPCPFCGSEAHLFGLDLVECKNCKMGQHFSQSKESSVKSWNTRHPTHPELVARVKELEASAGFCEKHQPNGGTRNCLVCGCERLSFALDRISYLCCEPNEMGVSEYSATYNEEFVVEQVKKLQSQLTALTKPVEGVDEVAKNVAIDIQAISICEQFPNIKITEFVKSAINQVVAPLKVEIEQYQKWRYSITGHLRKKDKNLPTLEEVSNWLAKANTERDQLLEQNRQLQADVLNLKRLCGLAKNRWYEGDKNTLYDSHDVADMIDKALTNQSGQSLLDEIERMRVIINAFVRDPLECLTPSKAGTCSPRVDCDCSNCEMMREIQALQPTSGKDVE